jgi:large subunit ribosomal protein L28
LDPRGVRNDTREHARPNRKTGNDWPALALSGTLFRLPTSGISICMTSFWERTPVAAVCDVCGKRPGFGHNVPWSKKKTNRRWNPNIQRVRAIVSGSPKRLNVCTSCIKAGKVTR